MSEGRKGREALRMERLHAYHDGELSAFGRWRFERELRRSPAVDYEVSN